MFDTPHLQVLVGKRVRKRLDARSIVQLLQSFGVPHGIRLFFCTFKLLLVFLLLLCLHCTVLDGELKLKMALFLYSYIRVLAIGRTFSIFILFHVYFGL